GDGQAICGTRLIRWRLLRSRPDLVDRADVAQDPTATSLAALVRLYVDSLRHSKLLGFESIRKSARAAESAALEML
ncbi:MAG: hypothetical protein RJB08_1645, partial [Actinomycetota bacterium]